MEIKRKICENCGCEHDGSYSSGRFCSVRCARSYSTKNEPKEKKKARCIICGKDIYINKRASARTCKCVSCKEKHHKPSDLRKCKLCGSSYYKYDGGCNNAFCKTHTLTQIKSLIRSLYFNKRKLGTPDIEEEFNRVRDTLIYLYEEKRLSFNEIGELYGLKYPNNLSKIFKYLGIPVRTRREVTENAILTGRLLPQDNYKTFRFKSEYHTTWDNKTVYLRSSYESDYANELDRAKILYEVEALRIRYFDTRLNKYRCAIPDFYIPSENLIVEIKSSYTLDIQKMKDRVKSYKENGYSVKVICDHKEIDIEKMEALQQTFQH